MMAQGPQSNSLTALERLPRPVYARSDHELIPQAASVYWTIPRAIAEPFALRGIVATLDVNAAVHEALVFAVRLATTDVVSFADWEATPGWQEVWDGETAYMLTTAGFTLEGLWVPVWDVPAKFALYAHTFYSQSDVNFGISLLWSPLLGDYGEA